MTAINWQQTCCAWHGEYAEHATKDGGVARLKRSPDKPATPPVEAGTIDAT